jgi:hypothetical protein
MRIFLSVQHLGSFLVYEPVIRELARRGHTIHLAVSRAESLGWEKTLDEVRGDHSNISWSWLSPSPSTSPFWFELAKTIRLWADYLRYFDPYYADAPKLKARAEERVPPKLVRISQHAVFRDSRNRARLLWALRSLERSLPAVEEIRRELREFEPDVVLITPLVYLGSWQFEVLRAALAEGLRTAFAVGSWDHLSSKALVRDVPQRVFVWNDTQKAEAVRLHGVPAERVIVTGAQCYDRWFGRQPARTRDGFCSQVGLPADRPLVLYVCSALFWGSPVEAEFVCRWIRSLRRSEDPDLRSAAILIRPHPARMDEWKAIDLSQFEAVALYGSNPTDDSSREDYFESLYYSRAVVGLNTSAFLEAAIVERPVHTILTPEFAENQTGTLHFHYLLTVGGGVLQTSTSFEEHHARLGASLRRSAAAAGTNPRFVHDFIRPRGLETPATTVFCDAVDGLVNVPIPSPERTPLHLLLVRWAAYPVFLALKRVYGTALFRDDWRRADPEHQRRLQERAKERQARHRAAEETKRAREQRRAAKTAARATAVRDADDAREQARAEKARRQDAKVRAKTTRARQRVRTAIRSRIRQSAKSWLARLRPGRQGQPT